MVVLWHAVQNNTLERIFLEPLEKIRTFSKNFFCQPKILSSALYHWLGAYRTNALYSGHIFVRFNDLADVFT